ncbi:MAG: hypothetical protein ACKPJF_19415 [Dolichospermum sp.]
MSLEKKRNREKTLPFKPRDEPVKYVGFTRTAKILSVTYSGA